MVSHDIYDADELNNTRNETASNHTESEPDDLDSDAAANPQYEFPLSGKNEAFI